MSNLCMNELKLEFADQESKDRFLQSFVGTRSMGWIKERYLVVDTKKVYHERSQPSLGSIAAVEGKSILLGFDTRNEPPVRFLHYLSDRQEDLGIHNIYLEAIEPDCELAWFFEGGELREMSLSSEDIRQILRDDSKDWPFEFIQEEVLADMFDDMSEEANEED